MKRLPKNQEEILHYLMTSKNIHGTYDFPIAVSSADYSRSGGTAAVQRDGRTLKAMEKKYLLNSFSVESRTHPITVYQITPDGELYFNSFLKEE